MKKIKLTLEEVYILNYELVGGNNIKGILSEKLNLVLKYRLSKLSEELKKEVSLLDTLRNELIKKYGDLDDSGNYILPPTIENKINPKFIEFNKEFSELLSQEKELDYYEIELNDLKHIETEDNYIVLFKLIKE